MKGFYALHTYTTKKSKEMKKHADSIKRDQKKPLGMLKTGTTRKGWFDKYK